MSEGLKVMQSFDVDTWTAYGGHIEFTIRHGMDNCLHLMARPYQESVHGRTFYIKNKWVVQDMPWHNSWWARLFRWLAEKNLCPYPFRQIAQAKEWALVQTHEYFPEEILDKIQVQWAVLEDKGIQPVAICCGPLGQDQLRAEARGHFGWQIHFDRQDWMSDIGWQLFGLPVRVIPWLAPGEVMVV